MKHLQRNLAYGRDACHWRYAGRHTVDDWSLRWVAIALRDEEAVANHARVDDGSLCLLLLLLRFLLRMLLYLLFQSRELMRKESQHSTFMHVR